MLRFIFLVFFSLFSLSSAVEIINGQWNGHPWNKKELNAKAASGDTHAMAEWAYCSFYGENGIIFDKQKAFKFAEAASKKGSILGKSLEGFFYTLGDGVKRDLKKGEQLIDEAKNTKHPFSRFIYAQNLNDPSSGRRDQKTAIALFQELTSEDVALASALHGFFLKNPWSPIYDRQKADRVLKESFEKYGSTISTFLQYQDIDRCRKIYGNRYADKVTQRLHQSAKIGHNSSLRTLGFAALKNKDYNTAVYYLLRAIEQGDSLATNQLIRSLDFRSDLPISVDFQDLSKLASIAYRNGSRSKETIREHIQNLRRINCFGTPTEESSANNIIRLSQTALKKGDCNIHDLLMRFYLHRASQQGAPIENFDKGIQHGIYHTNHSKGNLYWCAYHYLDLNHPKTTKIPEGLAMAEAAMPHIKEATKPYLRKLVSAAKLKATPEELARVQELLKDGYPTSNKWRLKAFKKLQQYGDIAEDAQF